MKLRTTMQCTAAIAMLVLGAIDAGATVIEEPRDTPYGDRRAMVRDPFGNVFQIAHQLRTPGR